MACIVKDKQLPISQHLSHSRSLKVEVMNYRPPLIFEIADAAIELNDFPKALHKEVQFIKKAIRQSFEFQKSNSRPGIDLLNSWGEEITRMVNGIYVEDDPIIPIVTHLTVLFDFWAHDVFKPEFDRYLQQHHSLQWYRAAYVYNNVLAKEVLDEKDFSLLVDTISKSKSQALLENISMLALAAINSHHSGKEHLEAESFRIWQNSLEKSLEDIVCSGRRVSKFIVEGAENLYANKLRIYTLSHLLNGEYFKATESKLFIEKDFRMEKETKYMVKFPFSEAKEGASLKLSKLKLLKFTSHLQMISHPMPLVEIKGLNDTLQKQYNNFIKITLFNKGFADSRGMLKTNKIYVNSKEYILSDEFLRTLINTRESFYEKYFNISKKQILPIDNYEYEEIKRDLSKQIQELEQRKLSITSFKPTEGLILFNKLLTEINGFPNLKEIKLLVENCLSIKYYSQKILNNYSITDIEKNTRIFHLSKEIVDDFLNKNSHLIFQIIVNKHAFYVGIKNLYNQFQIMIVNGGNLDMHDKYIEITSSEFDDPTHGIYHVMGSEELNKSEYSLFLQHYIYKLLISRNGKNSNILKSIYLNEINGDNTVSFYGYNNSYFIIPDIMQKLDKAFLAQTSNNCIIHNLKNCIRYLFDMRKSEYGMLENEILKSADKLISEFLSPNKEISDRICEETITASYLLEVKLDFKPFTIPIITATILTLGIWAATKYFCTEKISIIGAILTSIIGVGTYWIWNNDEKIKLHLKEGSQNTYFSSSDKFDEITFNPNTRNISGKYDCPDLVKDGNQYIAIIDNNNFSKCLANWYDICECLTCTGEIIISLELEAA